MLILSTTSSVRIESGGWHPLSNAEKKPKVLMIEVGGKNVHPKTLLSHQYTIIIFSWSLFLIYTSDRRSLFPSCKIDCRVFFFFKWRLELPVRELQKSLKNHDRVAFPIFPIAVSNFRRSHLPAYLISYCLQGIEVRLVSIDQQPTLSIPFSWKLIKMVWQWYGCRCHCPWLVVFDTDTSLDGFFHT